MAVQKFKQKFYKDIWFDSRTLIYQLETIENWFEKGVSVTKLVTKLLIIYC